MKLEMVNIMDADADAHVTARMVEMHVEILFGHRIGQKPVIKPISEPWWPSLLKELSPYQPHT